VAVTVAAKVGVTVGTTVGMGDRVSEGSGLIDLVGDLVAALTPPHPSVLITFKR
jgi:hypothetical protein